LALGPDVIDLTRKSNVVARNRCCQCGHEWQDRPMGYAQHHTCPKCGSVYWEWLDYRKPDTA